VCSRESKPASKYASIVSFSKGETHEKRAGENSPEQVNGHWIEYTSRQVLFLGATYEESESMIREEEGAKFPRSNYERGAIVKGKDVDFLRKARCLKHVGSVRKGTSAI
jgi:hypothetical protein